MKRKKSNSKGYKTKRVVDFKHPSEEIYLQRIIPAHERRKNREVRRQKKKVQLVMTEDNDVFDHDFWWLNNDIYKFVIHLFINNTIIMNQSGDVNLLPIAEEYFNNMFT